MATAIFNQFLSLSNAAQAGSNSYNVVQISGLSHYLGVSANGFPMFFVACSNNAAAADIDMDSFSVKFNCQCTLNDAAAGTSSQGVYSIFTFEEGSNALKAYFIEIFHNVLTNHLQPNPKVEDLQQEIYDVIKLFKTSPSFSEATVQGLWAELYIIAHSKDPLYLVQAWHVNTNDKYDFNDSTCKLEVKGSSKMQHIHDFSWEQINPLPGNTVVVASMFVSKAGIGKNIFDLEADIANRLTDAAAINKLKKEIVRTIGKRFEEASIYYYDEKVAKGSLNFYDSADIPTIDSNSIPPEISKVHYVEDLSGVTPKPKNQLAGKLYQSL